MENTEVQPIESFNPRKHMKSENKIERTRDQPDPRPPIVFGTGSQFNLPTSIVQKLKDDGKVVGFVVYSSKNEEQILNYEKAIDRGWVPLDSRDFPELSRNYRLSPFAKREEDYLVRRGGQVAMIRDKDIDDAERLHYDSERQRAEQSALIHRIGDPASLRMDTDHRTRGMRF